MAFLGAYLDFWLIFVYGKMNDIKCMFLFFKAMKIREHSWRQPYVTLSLLSTANANALPETSGARGTECYRRSMGIVSLVVGLPFAPSPRIHVLVHVYI